MHLGPEGPRLFSRKSPERDRSFAYEQSLRNEKETLFGVCAVIISSQRSRWSGVQTFEGEARAFFE